MGCRAPARHRLEVARGSSEEGDDDPGLLAAADAQPDEALLREARGG